MSDFSFKELSTKWPSPIVARAQVERFSGGLLNARTLANLDSIGEGPPVENADGRFFTRWIR